MRVAVIQRRRFQRSLIGMIRRDGWSQCSGTWYRSSGP
jgi:hypothetical protein